MKRAVETPLILRARHSACVLLPCAMMFKTIAFLLTLTAATTFAGEPSPKDLVAQFYRAHGSKHDPLSETKLLGGYFDTTLLNLYLKDQREAKGEVGRLDGDPLYNAQDFEIKDFSISAPEMAEGPSRTGTETRVTVRFKNIGKPTRVVYVLNRTTSGWRISDIRYDDGSSLKKILQAPL
jgi:hypothetical protein